MGSSDRFPYETSTVLDQDFLDDCQDTLTNRLELGVDIERPDSGFIRASDRNKYIGSTFYEALLNIPIITRTVGDWLSNVLEFGVQQLRISNVDGRFNNILPGGADFDGWVGKSITIRMGLRDVESTYTDLFQGKVTPIGGFGRDVQAVIFQARDQFDDVNKTLPQTVFKDSTFTDISDNLVGTPIPLIWGDWTTNLVNSADVKSFVVNTEDDDMNGESSRTNNVDVVISQNANKTFDTSNVYLRREVKFPDGSVADYHLMDSADIVNVAGDNNRFEVDQDTGNTQITNSDGANINYVYESGDSFVVRVVGVDLGAYDGNAVEIAKDILKTYGGLVDADFDANWATYRDKAAPAQSAIANIPCREWRQEEISAIELALSILEQVRLESFVSRDLKFKLFSLHFEDFVANPSFRMTNFDLQKDSFRPNIDVRNNFNRAAASYNRNPESGENEKETDIFRNVAAVSQVGRAISKRVVYPNLPVRTDVENQLTEVIRIASGTLEIITYVATWRSLLLDIGDFVKVNVQIGSSIYEDVPCVIRSIGVDPQGLKIPIKVWSLQMLPFPGYEPGYAGTVGGYNAIILRE